MSPDGGSLRMESPGSGRMQRFVTDLLVREGAIVDAVAPDCVEVLAPPPVQQALLVPELCRMGFGATVPPGAQAVGIEGAWLDRFGRLLGERGRWTRRVLPADPRTPSDPERVLARELVLDNATFRLLGVDPAWTRYLVLAFRFSAVSDEKRDGMLRVGLNLGTGAMPEAVLDALAPWLDDDAVPATVPDAADLPPAWNRARVLDRVAQALPPRLDLALAPFVRGLRRRLGRDQDRLHGYHNDLLGEAMRRAAAHPDGSPPHQREMQRAEAIRREYQAKLDDLARQYAMRVTVAWVQTLELAMPVQRFAVQIRRRKAERVIRLDWNPLARRLEQPACAFSHSAERPRLVCDDALHLVIPAGLAPCPGCGKPFCRACHRDRCPKCGDATHAMPPISLA